MGRGGSDCVSPDMTCNRFRKNDSHLLVHVLHDNLSIKCYILVQGGENKMIITSDTYETLDINGVYTTKDAEVHHRGRFGLNAVIKQSTYNILSITLDRLHI